MIQKYIIGAVAIPLALLLSSPIGQKYRGTFWFDAAIFSALVLTSMLLAWIDDTKRRR